MKRLVLSIVLAAVLWSVMFSPLTAPHVNFWLMMSLSALTLSVLSLRFDAGWRREADSSWTNLLLGIVIAVALWASSGRAIKCRRGFSTSPARRLI